MTRTFWPILSTFDCNYITHFSHSCKTYAYNIIMVVFFSNKNYHIFFFSGELSYYILPAVIRLETYIRSMAYRSYKLILNSLLQHDLS